MLDVLANYGRKAAALLPRLDIRGVKEPVVEVIDERNGELVYCVRLREASWQPFVFAEGKYTVRVSEPEMGKVKELKGVDAKVGNETRMEVMV